MRAAHKSKLMVAFWHHLLDRTTNEVLNGLCPATGRKSRWLKQAQPPFTKGVLFRGSQFFGAPDPTQASRKTPKRFVRVSCVGRCVLDREL